MWICNDMNKNIFKFITFKMAIFGTWLNFTYSLLQNILARILSINNIYRSLASAYATEDDMVIWFDFGRLVRILMIFPPIELEEPDEDWYYNAELAYYNAGQSTGTTASQFFTPNPPPVVSVATSRPTFFSLFEGHSLDSFRHLNVKAAPTLNESSTGDLNSQVPFEEVNFSFDTAFAALRGFAEGTAVVGGSSFIRCNESVSNFTEDLMEVYSDYATEVRKLEGFDFTHFDLWPYLIINDKAIGLLYAVHGLVTGCYYGGFELWSALSSYVAWVYDAEFVARSSGWNAGFIYTNIRDIWLYAARDPRTPIKSIYSLGLRIGQLYYFILISEFFS